MYIYIKELERRDLRLPNGERRELRGPVADRDKGVSERNFTTYTYTNTYTYTYTYTDKLAAAVLTLVIELYVNLAPPHVKSRFFGLLLHYVLLCMCSRASSLPGGGVGGGGVGGEGTPLWKAGAGALMAPGIIDARGA